MSLQTVEEEKREEVKEEERMKEEEHEHAEHVSPPPLVRTRIVGPRLIIYLIAIITLIIIAYKYGYLYIIEGYRAGWVTLALCVFGIIALLTTYIYINVKTKGELATVVKYRRYWSFREDRSDS